jgi:hypothetical protein
LAVELVQQVNGESAVPILAIFAGADASTTVIRPCWHPGPDQRWIEIVTRLKMRGCITRPILGHEPKDVLASGGRGLLPRAIMGTGRLPGCLAWPEA